MDNNIKITLNLDGLSKLKTKLKKNKQSYVRIGILGNKTNRKDDGTLTNAEIGAIHEFGSFEKKIPRRSFIKDPLNFKKNILEQKLIELVRKHFKDEDGLMIVLKKMGIVGESIIQEAFASGGFGKWAELKQSTIKAKKSNAKLIDTGELRRSVTSDVKNK